MLAAIAYVVVVAGRIPVVLFLKYDPKDIITLGGLIWGPLTTLRGAITGLFAGSLAMVLVMMLWNYHSAHLHGISP